MLYDIIWVQAKFGILPEEYIETMRNISFSCCLWLAADFNNKLKWGNDVANKRDDVLIQESYADM